MLKTILRNLISNSIKFTNPAGLIEIKAIQKKNFVEITVSDDGVGIDAETLKDLFVLHINDTKLGTAKESGSGLGLILCKEFAEKHSGKIGVESEIGKGSTFTLNLPLGS
jgi:signal transduction histidine kinase